MQNFSNDLFMQNADFKIQWNLIAENKSDGTSIREYEADAPVKRYKYHKRVIENASSCRTLLSASFS